MKTVATVIATLVLLAGVGVLGWYVYGKKPCECCPETETTPCTACKTDAKCKCREKCEKCACGDKCECNTPVQGQLLGKSDSKAACADGCTCNKKCEGNCPKCSCKK